MPPFVAEVDLDAIRSNVAELRRRAGSAAVMAVVKADGYGHGMVPSARTAVEAGASWLGVAFIDEALAQRTFPNEDPIGNRLSQSRNFSPVYEIVGIVRHVEQYNLDNPTVRLPQF